MKVNNNSIKGALVSASLATVLGGWALFGLDDRRQALANANLVDDLSNPVPAIDEAVNYVPRVETVPVEYLLKAGFGRYEEIPDLVLPSIPEVIKRDQRADLGQRPVTQLPSLPSLTRIPSDSGAFGSTRRPLPKIRSAGPSVSQISNRPSASPPAFAPLPALPSMPSLGQIEPLSALKLPPLPAVTKPLPKPPIRTGTSR